MNRLVPLLAFLLVLSGCAAPAPTGTTAEPTADASGSGVESTEATTTAEPAETSQPTETTTTVEPGETTATATTTTESAETTTTTEPTETTTVETTLESERLPTNETAIYDRVAAILDTDAAQPPLELVDDPGRRGGNVSAGMAPYERLLLDVSDRDGGGTDPPNVTAVYDQRDGRVNVLFYGSVPTDDRKIARLEHVLAHEYAHAALLDDSGYRRAVGVETLSTENRLLSQSLVEGPAMYVTDVYGERYAPETDRNPLERTVERLWNGSEYYRYTEGTYLFGQRYFEDRFDSPANVTQAALTFPATTEELIHGYEAGSERPATLSVNVDGSDAPTDSETDTTGELFVRSVLGGELPDDRAAAAAAGWGNDRVVDLGASRANETGRTNRTNETNVTSERNYAWALRWDDERNATEFARAFADYMDARGDRVGERRWRDDGAQFGLQRASDDTVVVLFGNSRIVQNATVSGENGTVTVELPSG